MTTDQEKIKSKIVEYLVDKQRARVRDLDGGRNLFEDGIVDSMGAFDLAAFIEKTFDLKFEEEHFFDKRFRTLDGMVSLISQIKSGRSVNEK